MENSQGNLPHYYRGTIAKTKNGHTCQNWLVHAPQKHDDVTPEIYPEGGLGDHNYCRNPDGKVPGAWCYTTDGPRFEYCACTTPCTTRIFEGNRNFTLILGACRHFQVVCQIGSLLRNLKTLLFTSILQFSSRSEENYL